MAKIPLLILSGPSGSGKSTVIERLLAAPDPPMRLSVSVTTRPPRGNERDGVHYHFWTRERFEEEVRAGAFLEWAKVFDQCYGTLRREVEPYQEKGTIVLLEIDVQGAAQVRSVWPHQVSVFLRPPSLQVLEERLRKRGTEGEAAIRRRLEGAQRELERAGEYNYQVVNEDLETAVAQLRAILRLEMAIAELRAILRRQCERGSYAG
jgi:guanylate kinase